MAESWAAQDCRAVLMDPFCVPGCGTHVLKMLKHAKGSGPSPLHGLLPKAGISPRVILERILVIRIKGRITVGSSAREGNRARGSEMQVSYPRPEVFLLHCTAT